MPTPIPPPANKQQPTNQYASPQTKQQFEQNQGKTYANMGTNMSTNSMNSQQYTSMLERGDKSPNVNIFFFLSFFLSFFLFLKNKQT